MYGRVEGHEGTNRVENNKMGEECLECECLCSPLVQWVSKWEKIGMKRTKNASK